MQILKRNWILGLTLGMTILGAATPALAGVPIATVDNVSQDISHITLSSDGVLSVTLRSTREVKEKAIAPANFALLNNEASILSGADIQTKEQVIRCMVMLPAWQPSLDVSGVDSNYHFTGVLREVLSFQSCGMAELVAPALPEQKALAEQLESSLIILANELVN